MYGRTYVNQYFKPKERLGKAQYYFSEGQNSSFIDESSFGHGNLLSRLSDGTLFPNKLEFKNQTFDEKTRTWNATLDFSDFGKNVTYRDSKRWVYNVVFSENYTNIIDGTVTIESDINYLETTLP